jgi:hypothetical protein
MSKISPKNLKDVERELRYSEEEKDKLKAKLERFEGEEDRQQTRMRSYHEELESQVLWLRRLVEDIVIPKEKIETIMKLRNSEIRISGENGGMSSRRNF